jgi:hypothetical protein
MNFLLQENDTKIVSYNTIRKAVGLTGILLPLILVMGNIILGNCKNIQESISAYYYTKMGYTLVGCLCAVALFLFCYRGHQKIDTWASNFAGICALGIAFFPTTGSCPVSNCIKSCNSNAPYISILHNVFAALFFITLALISLKLFTMHDANPTPQKVKRNTIYKICGWIILICIATIAADTLFTLFTNRSWQPIFVLETIALFAFGISWLVKGGMVMCD